MKPESTTQIIDDVITHYEILNKDFLAYQWNENVLKSFRKFHSVLKTPLPEEECAAVLKRLEQSGMKEKIYSLYCTLLRECEYFAIQQIPNTLTWDFLLEFPDHFYFLEYLASNLVEFSAIEIQSNDRLLYIGSGPTPLTPISLLIFEAAQSLGLWPTLRESLNPADPYKTIDTTRMLLKKIIPVLPSRTVKITGIDLDQTAVEMSKKFISDLGLSNQIECVQCNALQFNEIALYDSVLCAASVRPKREILESLLKKVPAQKQLKILLRTVNPRCLLNLIYDSSEDVLSTNPPLSELKRTQHYPSDPEAMMLYNVEVYSFQGT